MLCRQCQRENPPQNAFCHACGTPLAALGAAAQPAAPAGGVRCTRCGADNPKGFQFCRTCGTDLTSADAARARAPEPAAAAPAGLGLASPASLRPSIPLQPTAPAPAPAQKAAAGAVCRRCGGHGDPNARFCKFCGSPFDAPAAAPVPPPTAAAGHPIAAAAPAPAPSPRDMEFGATHPLKAQVVIIQRDGSEGGVFALDGPHTDVGSREGEIVLSDDPYLSPRHARLERRGDTFVLRDLDSANGAYVRLREPVELSSGDMFLIGQQVLRFEVLPEAERRVGPAKQHGVMVFGTPELPRLARIAQYTTEGLERDVYYLYRDETVFGREQADIVFAEDPFLSRRHAVISMDRDHMRFTLRDLGSSNGSALRLRSPRALQNGDQFRLGRHLFRFDLTVEARAAQVDAGGRGGRVS